ncbi:unnamed protein product [Moneuplotes crassus]|uniref:Uncharacterized protein n=1 Tax=Euplotes crassus TaxID=5936 RepID=A0AAD1Y1G5_EUPCR|nr:unnamed protein product [Moneuplotes crassus]CAI2383155.1 unnamed protein product [Moneuplotes crassus]
MLKDYKYGRLKLRQMYCLAHYQEKFKEEVEELASEDPEALSKLGLTKLSAIRKLALDECKEQTKIVGDLHRYRKAEVTHGKYLAKQIRALHNGGMHFNPYL